MFCCSSILWFFRFEFVWCSVRSVKNRDWTNTRNRIARSRNFLNVLFLANQNLEKTEERIDSVWSDRMPRLRASTLLHVSGFIARLIQCHVRFLVMWRRESDVREWACCFARQPPHKLNFRTMKQLDHNCISCLINRLKITCHAWDFLLDDTNAAATFNRQFDW